MAIAEQEIAEATKGKGTARVILRYDLPDNLGTRTLVETTGW